MFVVKNKRRFLLILIDFAIYTIVFSLFALASYLIQAPGITKTAYFLNYILFLVMIFASRFFAGCYSCIWRYANSMVFFRLVFADAFGGVLALAISFVIPNVHIGVLECAAVVCINCITTLCSRFFYQMRYRSSNESDSSDAVSNKIGVAIVGAGQIGTLLAEELIYRHSSHYKPICFIDKNKDKIGSTILGLKVYADDDRTLEVLRSLPVQEIFIAIPELSSERTKALFDFYSKSGCKVKVYDLPLDEDGFSTGEKRMVREIRIEDLLFRDSLKVASSETRAFYKGKTVLVTGGGGSIGSELSRQIAGCEPKRLIIFDIYENNAYDIQQELIRHYGDKLDLCVEIGSVRDPIRLEAVFENYRPDIVFHAAAHKHVPLMEHSTCEAIKNNVIGTYNTANMAEKYGVKKFILISTDKAVNPTNVMGASKRLCEMVIQCRTDSKTSFSAVRFGNVLGSNGSVIPLFKRQIEEGGPITITDKRIIRYFMTIPEASGLVMQAGAMAQRGELFVLDMGKPVKIIDLAENMIKLSGYIPYRDIDIVETGLRPGEKLYEELLIKTERLNKTDNDMIFIESDQPFTRDEMEAKLEMLRDAVKNAEHELKSDSIRKVMMQVVPTFHTPEEVNKRAQEAEEMKAVLN